MCVEKKTHSPTISIVLSLLAVWSTSTSHRIDSIIYLKASTCNVPGKMEMVMRRSLWTIIYQFAYNAVANLKSFIFVCWVQGWMLLVKEGSSCCLVLMHCVECNLIAFDRSIHFWKDVSDLQEGMLNNHLGWSMIANRSRDLYSSWIIVRK